MKKQIISLSFIFLITIILGGCSKIGVATLITGTPSFVKYSGIPYFLPKKVLELKITYTIRQKTQKKFGYVQQVATPEVIIIKPIEITPIVVADKLQTFYLIGKDVSESFFESNLVVNLGEEGNIQSIGGEFSDKSLDAFQNILTAGIGIAKIIAVAGPEEEIPVTLKDVIENIIPNIYKQIANLVSKTDPEVNAKLETFKTQLETLYGLIENYQENNKEFFEENEYEYKEIVDPEMLTKETINGKVTYSKIIRPNEIIKGVKAQSMPPVKLILDITDIEFKNLTTNIKTAMNITDDNVPGVIFRSGIPILTKITVNAENAMVFNGYISYPQFGKYSIIPVDSKRFTKQNTSLIFQSQSGGLKEYRIESGSSAEALSQQLSTTVSALQQAVLDLNYSLKLQNLQQQKALAEAEAELLKAKQELEELKANEKNNL